MSLVEYKAPEPFAQLTLGNVPQVRSMIERVPNDRRVASQFEAWKALMADGWAVSALLAPDKRTVLLLACREVAA